ncbi:hypothetical protein H6F88_31790 [Oculatella sp. FACHB-28]|uniref:hypothetical protein n=1 Tax=Oculatella sp. FACHB-28 TaxID=2692845 RepID=UPI0016832095|nr:hypothetical protein [Oculatella sp. FACHB-28]MBD2060526.1 hypothetical protein [Oculatella sp. FACHB-28]
MRKSIFLSSTFWSIILLLMQATIPSIQEALKDGEVDLVEGLEIAQVLVVATLGVVGRVSAGDVYTPKGIPGPNKNDR